VDGGNYSEIEIEWYREQMDEIDQLFTEMIEKRKEQMLTINEQTAQLKKDPAI
jgi:hypothetical protein